MTSFKVGDKVRRTKESMWPDLDGKRGSIYTVLSVDGDGWIKTLRKGKYGNCDSYELVTKEEEKPVYEVGEVYLWKGGECPLPKGTQVDVRLGSKTMSVVDKEWTPAKKSNDLHWLHQFTFENIVMFKVVSYPEPAPVKRSATLELTEEQLKAVESVLLKEGRL